MQETKKRAKRDPEGRKRAIAQAVARLLITEGNQHITHRKVAQEAGVPLGSTTQYFANITELLHAGYEVLAEKIDEDYQVLLRALQEHQGDLDAMVNYLFAYLDNGEEVRRDMALYSAAVKDPALRSLARTSFERFIEGLKVYMAEDQALAVAIFMDGVILQTSTYDRPLDEGLIKQVLRLLGTYAYKGRASATQDDHPASKDPSNESPASANPSTHPSDCSH